MDVTRLHALAGGLLTVKVYRITGLKKLYELILHTAHIKISTIEQRVLILYKLSIIYDEEYFSSVASYLDAELKISSSFIYGSLEFALPIQCKQIYIGYGS